MSSRRAYARRSRSACRRFDEIEHNPGRLKIPAQIQVQAARERLAPTPNDPCIEDRNRYSSDVLRWLSQFGEPVTYAIITAGV